MDDAVSLFGRMHQDFKVELLGDLKTRGTTAVAELDDANLVGESVERVSLYTTGEFTDLCRGPHVANTREIDPDSFKLTRVSGLYRSPIRPGSDSFRSAVPRGNAPVLSSIRGTAADSPWYDPSDAYTAIFPFRVLASPNSRGAMSRRYMSSLQFNSITTVMFWSVTPRPTNDGGRFWSEVGWPVLPVEHGDHDPQEATQLRHAWTLPHPMPSG